MLAKIAELSNKREIIILKLIYPKECSKNWESAKQYWRET
jgi:hypothetical protein